MATLFANPLATPDQLSHSPSLADGLPVDLEVSLLWAGSSLLQSAGILLELPQPTIAHAIVLFQRFYLVSSLRAFSLLDTCHAALYLASKVTEHAAKPRDIINVTAYLRATPTPSPISPRAAGDAHVEESTYYAQRTQLLTTELEMLRALGFQTACSLPYTLIVNYAQALECLTPALLKRAFGYANDALVSSSVVYCTHQPNQLAVAAVYLAAREEGAKLPDAWWEVFDVEREELGFLVAVMKGVTEFVEAQVAAWGKRELPWERETLEEELERRRLLADE